MQPLWKTVWKLLRKLRIELLYDPAIPLLHIYPDKTQVQKDACTPMFIAALFTIAKTWKQSKWSIDRGMDKKMWNIHTMEYHSALKKNKIMPLTATWMDLEIIILNEVRRRNLKVPNDILHIWHEWTYLQTRNRLTDIENRLAAAKREEPGEGMEWETGFSRCKLLCTELINSKVLPTSQHRELYVISYDKP